MMTPNRVSSNGKLFGLARQSVENWTISWHLKPALKSLKMSFLPSQFELI